MKKISLLSLMLLGFLLGSCSKDDSSILLKGEEPQMEEASLTKVVRPDVQFDKMINRLIKAVESHESLRISKLMNNNSIIWDDAIRITQGKREGYFVRVRQEFDNSFTVLAFLEINSKKEVFLIDYENGNHEGAKLESIVLSNITGQKMLEKTYENHVLVSDFQMPFLMTKCDYCEMLNNNKATFSDYNQWFSTSCSSQRFGNASSNRVWYKPENGTCNNSTYLDANEWTDIAIDGFACEGQVVKICNGYKTCLVKGKNDYLLKFGDYIWGQIAQWFTGGVKDKAWLEDLHSGDDYSWDSLFDKADEQL